MADGMATRKAALEIFYQGRDISAYLNKQGRRQPFQLHGPRRREERHLFPDGGNAPG
jgi:hypothetical protein